MKTILCVLLFVAVVGAAFAQEATPDPSDPEAVRQSFLDEARAQWPSFTREEYATIQVAATVVVGEGFDAAARYLDPAVLTADYGIVQYDSIEALRSSESVADTEALLLLGLRLDSLSDEDLHWLSTRYHDGLVFGFLNVPVQERMVMMGWPECRRAELADLADIPVDNYIVNRFKVAVTVPEDFALAMEDLRACRRIATGRFAGSSALSIGFAADNFKADNADVIALSFLWSVALNVKSVREAENFALDSSATGK